MRSLFKKSLLPAVILAAAFGTLVFPSAAGAGTLVLYHNALNTTEGRTDLRLTAPRAECVRGGSPKALRFRLGKLAKECFYRTPLVGMNMQISGTARIFKSTPRKVLRRTYAGISLRQHTDGSRYQFVVWPWTRRYGLRKVQPDGTVLNLGSRKAGKKVRGPGLANRLTLRAFTGPRGVTQVIGWANGHKLAVAADRQGTSLVGRDSTISIGSKNRARGAIGSFVNLRISVPDPN